MVNNILTIDGPSGVGKSTIAKIIANNKGWHLLDSGAIYRAFALAVKQYSNKVAFDESELLEVAKNFNLRFNNNSSNIYLNDVEVSALLRTESIANLASKLSAIGLVRKILIKQQKNFAKMPGLVADGRDMGTVVFPNALYKVFLTAGVKERSKRRLKQLQVKGNNAIMAVVLAEINKRDYRDYNRKVSPLIAAKDAVIIDTGKLSIDATVTKVMQLVGA